MTRHQHSDLERRHHEATNRAPVRRALLVARRAPAGARPARRAGRRRRPARPTSPSRRRRPTSRPAISTSTTCSRRAGTPATSTSTASRRCATSRRSRCTRRTPPPATASTTTAEKMLGGFTWGDVHHPALSETNGDYDGRWLFVNEMNGRVARVDLRDFKTKQILGPVPNISGNHASRVRHAEHRVLDDGVALLDSDPEGHASRRSTSTPPSTRASSPAIKIDPKSGEHDARLADPDAAVRLRPRRRRQEGVRRLDVLDVVQRRARHRQARDHRLAARPRLHRRHRLEAPPRRPRPRARAT